MTQFPQPPRGSGEHPISMVVLAANKLAASQAFYTKVFGWQMYRVSDDVVSAMIQSGPSITLRANTPEGFQSTVPFVKVANVIASLGEYVNGGVSVEREPWTIPNVGTMARIRDVSGTAYGLTDSVAGRVDAHIPFPFGDNPKPPANTVCSVEMYARDAASASMTAAMFGWGVMETMPQYVSFDAGVGIGGVFQSHTPSLAAVVYVYVDDVAAALRRVREVGGEPQGEPMAMPGMATFGYFADPSGTVVGLIGG